MKSIGKLIFCLVMVGASLSACESNVGGSAHGSNDNARGEVHESLKF